MFHHVHSYKSGLNGRQEDIALKLGELRKKKKEELKDLSSDLYSLPAGSTWVSQVAIRDSQFFICEVIQSCYFTASQMRI